MLDSGSFAGDFIAKRVVSQLRLEHHVVSNKSRTVCRDPDSKCYDISNTLAWYVFYFNELLKNVAYFKINAIILGSSPIDLLMVLYRVVLYCTYMHPCIYTVSHTTVQLLHRM